MDDDRDTPLTPHRSSGRAKRNGRLALDVHNLSQERFGEIVGVGPSLAKAWFNPASSNQLPAWAFEHPSVPAPVRETFRRLMAGEAPAAVAAAVLNAEDQANVATGRVGVLLAELSAALCDRKINAAEARALVPVAAAARQSLDRLDERLLDVIARADAALRGQA